jgi:hypothetical protein
MDSTAVVFRGQAVYSIISMLLLERQDNTFSGEKKAGRNLRGE